MPCIVIRSTINRRLWNYPETSHIVNQKFVIIQLAPPRPVGRIYGVAYTTVQSYLVYMYTEYSYS